MAENDDTASPSHFNGKEAIQHVIEAQAQGIVDASEVHGSEMPDHMSAAAASAREIAIAVLLIGLLGTRFGAHSPDILKIMLLFGGCWLIWRVGLSAWLGWARLERLHRLVEQERWEIEHHRTQEREELSALYRAKGFEGELLEQVIDVLMADGDRLLRVMLDEELHLRLEVHDHPLKQGLGALIGGSISLVACIGLQWLTPSWGAFAAGMVVVGAASGLASRYVGNRLIPALVWNVGIAALAYGTCRFLLDYLMPLGG